MKNETKLTILIGRIRKSGSIIVVIVIIIAIGCVPFENECMICVALWIQEKLKFVRKQEAVDRLE